MSAGEWVRADELRVGDNVRLPEGELISSWAHWLDTPQHRAAAEFSTAPFRRVERLEPSHDRRALQVWRGAEYAILPRDSFVLRASVT